MNRFKKLRAKISKWVEGDHRPRTSRPVSLGLQSLEAREVPASIFNIVAAPVGGVTTPIGSLGGVYQQFAISATNQVVEFSTVSHNWFPVTGTTNATRLAANASGLYMLGSNGAINQSVWRYDGSGQNWTKLTDITRATELVANNNGVYMMGSNGQGGQSVWQYGGSGQNWVPLTGITNASSIVANSYGLFMLGTNGAAYQSVWQYSNGNWSAPLTGTNTNGTALVGVHDSLFLLASNGAPNQSVFQYTSGSWTQVTGSNTYALELVSTGANLDMVGYNVGSAPQVWQYGYGTNWTPLSGTGLQNELSSWSLATTHPLADTSYAPLGGTLFAAGGPSFMDVQQGAAADCWLLASLAETAARRPNDIRNMFVYDGTAVENGFVVGVYSVLVHANDGSPRYVTVDTEFPSGGTYYDQPINYVLWAALAEKAYAEANGAGYVGSNNTNDNAYNALNFGDPSNALRAITGLSAGSYVTNAQTDLGAAWNAGKLIVLNTPTTPNSSWIVGNHCYAMVDYQPSSGQPYKIFNPWGVNPVTGLSPDTTKFGLFTANMNYVLANFSSVSFGNAAAPMTHTIAPAGTPPIELTPHDVLPARAAEQHLFETHSGENRRGSYCEDLTYDIDDFAPIDVDAAAGLTTGAGGHDSRFRSRSY